MFSIWSFLLLIINHFLHSCNANLHANDWRSLINKLPCNFRRLLIISSVYCSLLTHSLLLNSCIWVFTNNANVLTWLTWWIWLGGADSVRSAEIPAWDWHDALHLSRCPQTALSLQWCHPPDHHRQEPHSDRDGGDTPTRLPDSACFLIS